MINSSFGIAVWKDLYTCIQGNSKKIALLPIVSKFGQLFGSFQPPIGYYFHAMQWFLLRLFGFFEEWKLVSILRVDEVRQNTSQANYFEGFERITSQKKRKSR